MSKYYEVSISIEKVVTYAIEAESEVEAEHLALTKIEEDYASVLDSSGAIEEITEEQFRKF